MNETEVTVVGRLVADPEHRTSRAGLTFTTFRMATNARRRTKEGVYVDGPTSYYNVATYRSLGVNTHTSMRKGDPVVVRGRLTIRDFQRADESWGSSAEIDAYSVGHDLTWGTTEYTKAGRTGDGAAAVAGAEGYDQMGHRIEQGESVPWGAPVAPGVAPGGAMGEEPPVGAEASEGEGSAVEESEDAETVPV